MHAYDQQSWFLFHRCEPLSSFWTAEDRLYRNHQMKLIIIDFSESRKNQNTIEKNEFYEWKIWRTIMKIMNENNFICIKINSWFRKIEPRQHLFLTSVHTDQFFQQLIFFWSNENFASTSFYHRFHTDQHFNSWFFEINEDFVSISLYHRFVQANIWSASFRCNRDLVSTFVNRSVGHKFWLYENFLMIFISKNIFTDFFFSWNWILNLFHFILFYIQWLMISFWSFSLMKQSYLKKWLLMIELFKKFWKNCCI